MSNGKEGPMILDEEYLDFLQGEWIAWGYKGKGAVLTIRENRLTWLGAKDHPFHVVRDDFFRNMVYLTPADSGEEDFPGFRKIFVYPNMLTTYMKVYDQNPPMTIFARADMLDKIEIPAEAGTEPSGMQNRQTVTGGLFGLMGLGGVPSAASPQPEGTQPKKLPRFCSNCGQKLEGYVGKFCSNCGCRLEKEQNS